MVREMWEEIKTEREQDAGGVFLLGPGARVRGIMQQAPPPQPGKQASHMPARFAAAGSGAAAATIPRW